MRTVDLDAIILESGSHRPDHTFCVMELAAYIAEEPWSDHPKCVSRVIGAFLRSWNDSASRESRQRLKPFALTSLNTKGTIENETIRSWMAVDWLVRASTPMWLRQAGLIAQAETLERLPELNPQTSPLILPALRAIREDAAAARDAAEDSVSVGDAWDAWDDAGDIAGDASGPAWVAVWTATVVSEVARDDARDDARDIARDASWVAVWTARETLATTVDALQKSAFMLLDRMIEVGK